MKTLCSVLVVVTFLFGAALSQSATNFNCGALCNSDTVVCPEGSSCVTVLPTSSAKRCVCDTGYNTECTGSSTNVVLSCVQPNMTSIGCGNSFPRGCPPGSVCISVSTSAGGVETTCRCLIPGEILVDGMCKPVCPENAQVEPATNDTFRCGCMTGYEADPTTADLVCVPSPTSTCATLTTPCPSGYTCVDSTVVGTGPHCEPINTEPHCGVSFNCPDTVHFICQDTATGPKCVCNAGWGGIDCRRPACWALSNGQLGCWWDGAHATCVSDPTTATNDASTPYCVCTDGYAGDNCTIPVDPLCSPNIVTACGTLNNTNCVDGRCICAPGYVSTQASAASVTSDTVVGSSGCVPVNPPSCMNVTCNGNFVCVHPDATGAAHCACPTDVFGGYDCNHPRCRNDSDCSALTNSYCVYNTRPDVAGYCICKPGFSGDMCVQPTPCQCTDASHVCTNDGLCVCRAGSYGNICQDRNVSVCVSFVIRIRADLNATAIQEIIVELIHVDLTNVEVEGPLAGSATGAYLWNITICGDLNIDQNSSQQNFNTLVTSGKDGGMGVSGINPSSSGASTSSSLTSGSSPNGAALVTVSALFVAAMTFFALVF